MTADGESPRTVLQVEGPNGKTYQIVRALPGTWLRADYASTTSITGALLSLLLRGFSQWVGTRTQRRKIGVFEIEGRKAPRKRYKAVLATIAEADQVAADIQREIENGQPRWESAGR